MADPTIFEYNIQDDQGLTNRAALYMAYDGSTETTDALIGAWLAYGGDIDACIDGQIVNGRITIPLEPDGGWKSSPTIGNNVNQVMTLDFNNDFNRYLTPVLLPSYKEGVILAGTRTPDISHTPLSTLIALITGGSGSAFFPNSRDLHDLNALNKAFLTVRKVRNQRRKTTVFG